MAKAHTEVGSLQIDRFVEAARELGCDEDEAAFKEKLARIARQKPKDTTAASEGAVDQ